MTIAYRTGKDNKIIDFDALLKKNPKYKFNNLTSPVNNK